MFMFGLDSMIRYMNMLRRDIRLGKMFWVIIFILFGVFFRWWGFVKVLVSLVKLMSIIKKCGRLRNFWGMGIIVKCEIGLLIIMKRGWEDRGRRFFRWKFWNFINVFGMKKEIVRIFYLF